MDNISRFYTKIDFHTFEILKIYELLKGLNQNFILQYYMLIFNQLYKHKMAMIKLLLVVRNFIEIIFM